MKKFIIGLALLSSACAGDVVDHNETKTTLYRMTLTFSYIYDKENGLCWAVYDRGGLQPISCSLVQNTINRGNNDSK